MKSGFFLPISSNYRLAWLWGIIVLSFERILFYELDKHGNLFLSILMWLSYLTFIILIWPHRFFIDNAKLYFPTFPRLKMRDFDLKYVTAIRIGRFGCAFSYAGKRYHFFTLGQSKALFGELASAQNHQSEENLARVKA